VRGSSYTPKIPAVRRLRQKDHGTKANKTVSRKKKADIQMRIRCPLKSLSQPPDLD
jgi:hypothetical protein